MPLTKDEGAIIPFERLVKVFALQLQQIIVAIIDYDLDIAKRFRAHGYHKVFDSLLGTSIN